MRPLVLGTAAAWVRRTVGPVAWAVLESLADDADRDGDRTVSHTSVRGLAGVLGLANDTVARALRRLDDAGLARHEADRQPGGRFGAGRYVLTLPPDLFDAPADVLPPTPTPTAIKRPATRPHGEQLALLADD